ncbi:MAG: hypothetical protein US53_C0041G0003, partial [Candidatus Woesebacteria bacterium GW2011_GWA1_37_7]
MQSRINKLPKSFKKFFWDVDFEKIDTPVRYQFVIQRLLDKGDGVHPEPGDPLVDPPTHHIIDGLADRRVLPVQIRLFAGKGVEIVFPGRLVPFPDRPAKHRRPFGGSFAAISLLPDIPVALGAVLGAFGFQKPGVLVAGMVDHQVQQDADAVGSGRPDKFPHVLHAAELGVDGLVVADVIAVIVVWRGIHRANPDRVDAQVRQVGDAPDDAPQVANSIAVAVLETARVDLVDHASFPPGRVHIHAASLFHFMEP